MPAAVVPFTSLLFYEINYYLNDPKCFNKDSVFEVSFPLMLLISRQQQIENVRIKEVTRAERLSLFVHENKNTVLKTLTGTSEISSMLCQKMSK